eukprot:503836-Pelagomonas_calceolata.AAC.1
MLIRSKQALMYMRPGGPIFLCRSRQDSCMMLCPCYCFARSSCRYIQYTQQHFRNQGQQPPAEEFIRQHYRQQKQQLEASGAGLRL